MRQLFGVLALCAAWWLPLATPHSSLISPMPRNAIDRHMSPWRQTGQGAVPWGPGTVPGSPPGGAKPHCPHPVPTSDDGGGCWGCTCVNGTQPCDVGQTCVWFSQGCSIGCAACDGGESNPNKIDRCGSGMKPTNNDPMFRTYNRQVEAMSPEDWTQHNPWRCVSPPAPPPPPPGPTPIHTLYPSTPTQAFLIYACGPGHLARRLSTTVVEWPVVDRAGSLRDSPSLTLQMPSRATRVRR
jgi:hypothetical protein